jgi:hypothetical protein
MVRTGIERHAGWAAVAAMVMAGVASSGARAQTIEPPLDAGVTMAATVTVTRALLKDTGELLRELPTSRYTLAQFRDGRLRMTMLASRPGPRVGPMADPYAGMVVEGNLAEGTLELRDASGKRIALPASTGMPPAAAPGESFLAGTSEAPRRRQALERDYGRPAGRLRGLTRYVARRGTTTEEVLVASDTMLPAELNVVKDGVLTEHHAFSYRRLPGNRWVRQRSVAHTLVTGSTPQRMLSITTLDDIRADGGAR